MNKIKPIFWIYTLSVLLTLHVGVPLFINSTYLSSFTTDKMVGVIYSIGSIITILALLAVSRALERFGNYKTTLSLVIFEILTLLGLVLFQNFGFVILTFLGHFVLSTVISFNADIFLESYTKNSSTGATRGLIYSLMSIAWLFAPVIAGFLIGDSTEYWLVYAASIIFLIPIIVILMGALKNFKDAKYHHMSFFKDMKSLLRNKDEKFIFLAGLMLKFFFAWMVIYTPIYLNQHIGFDFKQIGIIFSIMMAAYVIFEWPIGYLADKKYGEKEILSIGFVIIALSTMLLSFITVPNIVLWIAVMFMTRVGAAMVEITTESYFFKKITSSDTDDISFWRMLRPIAYLVAPLLVSPFLIFFDFRFIFLGIGIFMLLGPIFAWQIKDTR